VSPDAHGSPLTRHELGVELLGEAAAGPGPSVGAGEINIDK